MCWLLLAAGAACLGENAAFAQAASSPKVSGPASLNSLQLSASQLSALPERTLVLAGLSLRRGRVVAMDARSVWVFESFTPGSEDEGESDADLSLALLAGASTDEPIDESLFEAFPREDVLAILPKTNDEIPAGLWAYAPGRATTALHRGAEASERERRRVEAALLEARLTELLDEQRAFEQAREDANDAADQDADQQAAAGDDAAPRIRPQTTTQAVPLYGRVLLVDGQYLTGTLRERADDVPSPDTLRWVDTLGDDRGGMGWQLPLERVRSLWLSDSTTPLNEGAGDVLVLRNNDVLRGFASTSWEAQELKFGVELAGAAGAAGGTAPGGSVTVPASRVAELHLENPMEPATTGALVWLGDQTIRVDNLAWQADVATMLWAAMPESKDTARELSMSAARVRAVKLAPARIAALAQQTIVQTTCPDGRRWCPPVLVGPVLSTALGAADIELPGPMQVTFALPEGAKGLLATIELPESSRELGRCTLVVHAAGASPQAKELARIELGGTSADAQASTRVPLRVALPSGSTTLVLTLDAGSDGPLQDRVLVRRGLLELDPAGD
jgi:hypothetical protein